MPMARPIMLRASRCRPSLTARFRSGYKSVHRGAACGKGWINANSKQSTISKCYGRCKANVQCAYFSYDGTTCAMYTLSGMCPANTRYTQYNSYKLSVPVPEGLGIISPSYDGMTVQIPTATSVASVLQARPCVDLFSHVVRGNKKITASIAIGTGAKCVWNVSGTGAPATPSPHARYKQLWPRNQ